MRKYQSRQVARTEANCVIDSKFVTRREEQSRDASLDLWAHRVHPTERTLECALIPRRRSPQIAGALVMGSSIRPE